MPCGCKAKKSQQTKIIVQNKIVPVAVHATQKLPVQQLPDSQTVSDSQSAITSQQIRNSLDVAATTTPDQLCFNCVRKHVSLAYFFLQKGERDIATGQFMCAGQHLRQKFPNIAQEMRYMAICILTQWPAQAVMHNTSLLLRRLSFTPQTDWQPRQQPYNTSWQQQLILNLCLVYSLLFVELGYQEVNKSWATGHLAIFAYDQFRGGGSTQMEDKLRPLWKLIQSMQPMSDNYFQARSYIEALLKEIRRPQKD